MNYLKEINLFRLYLRRSPIPPVTQALWYALIHRHNQGGWERWITIDNLSLQIELQVSKPTLNEHRNKLKTLGLLEYTSQQKKKNSGKYKLLSFELGEVKTGKNIYPDNETGKIICPVALPDSLPDSLHINKYINNKTKDDEHARNIYDFYNDNIGLIPKFVIESIVHWLDDGVEEALILRLMQDAVSRGQDKSNWNYVNACIKSCFNQNIKTLSEYELREEERKRNNSKPKTSKKMTDEEELALIEEALRQKEERGY